MVSVQGVASGTAIPVSGTFFQTTQPVSIAATVPVSIAFPALGSAASSGSLPVVLSNDQAEIPVITTPQVVLNTPTSNSMAALNSTVVYQVQAGGSYFLTLTNGPGATTAWVGTVTFQYSTNAGSSWSSLSVNPVAAPASSAATSTTTANGLFLVEIPAGVASQIVYIRANMTAFTSGTVYFFAAPNSDKQRVLMPWTYTVTSGQNLVAPIEASAFSEIDVQISAITTTVFTAQGTNDPTLTTFVALPAISAGTQAASVGTLSAALSYRIMTNGYKWIRIQCTTTGTVATIQGVVGSLGNQILLTAFGNDIGTTVNSGTLTAVTSLSQIAASVPLMTISNGSTNKGLGVTLGNATTLVDYTAQAWAAASGSGATVADTVGDGQSVSFAVSLTAWTAGSSTGLYIYLQESPDNGTTWTDIWAVEPFTAVGIARIPAIPIGGRRRMRWVNRAGAATTATVTVTAMKTFNAPLVRQFFDWGTTGTAANSNLITGAAATTSTSTLTSGLATLTQTTAAYPIDGCTLLTIKGLVTGGTATTAAILTLQVSDDFINWVSTGTTLTLPLVAGMSMVTLNGVAAKYARCILTTAQSGGTAVALSYISFMGVN